MMTHDDDHRKGRAAPGASPKPLDPVTVAHATDDASARLIHEVAGLVDGSLRYLNLAHRSLAERDSAPGAPSLAYLDSAIDALSRLASLVRDASGALTTASSLAMGRRLSIGQTLRDIIEHAVGVVRPLAEERAIAIDVALDPSIQHAARLPLYPVVMNGLRNAIESCAAGDRITLRAWTSTPGVGEGILELEICDTGAGPPSDPDRAFTPGFTTKPGGSGLGLAIARDIVEELGGEITLTPNTGPRGARLRVRVPMPGKDEIA